MELICAGTLSHHPPPPDPAGASVALGPTQTDEPTLCHCCPPHNPKKTSKKNFKSDQPGNLLSTHYALNF
ncbi:hypothetical protein NQZ68_013304 [Dissostichus eleginoides]|nr:hypothetical protein NQZ68_013304 [Dissostichus eleginoides]